MSYGSTTCLALLLVAGASPALAGLADQGGARQVTTPSDLPARTYVIQGKPSDVVQNHSAVLALARQVEANLKADLETLGTRDKATLTRMYSSLMASAMVKGDHAAARRYLELVRDLQDNPAVKLLTGVITIPYMQAMETPGPDFRATYRTLMARRLASLPFEDVRATLGAMKSSQESASKAQVIGSIVAGVDPAVKDGQLSQPIAEALVGAAMNLEVILPLKEDVVACIERLFDAARPTQPAAQPAVGTFKAGLKGIYFGQTLPGETPVPFAPEILTSISRWVAGTAFSTDGTQLFVAVGAPDYSGATLYYSTLVNDEWTPVVRAPFVSDFLYSNEPVFSADGKTLTFTGRKPTGTQDLWTVGYADQRWGTPVALPSSINSDAEEFRGSYMPDGTMYFTSARSGMYEVYKGYKDAAQALVVELVGPPISTNSYEGDPCIAPDGHFLIFNSVRDRKSADLYVSFRDARGEWGTPVKLGPEFNTPYDEYGAHLSSDGKYLFFTRHTPQGNTIYWVAVSAIEKLERSQGTFAGYLDQAPPDQTPRVFRLQTHDGYYAGDRIAISADGRELYYTEVTSTWSDYNIRYYKVAGQKWEGPFDLFPGFLGPALSVDGQTMSFEKYNDARTCWHSKRIDTGWSTPTLCTETPDPKDKHYLQDTASGRIYASSQGALNGIGQMDISTYLKADAAGAYHSLGRPLNSPGNEGDFYVARDEAFIVFGSPHRGGFGGGDLFISFRARDGSWSDPTNLGAAINTPGYEFGPYVTDDKRYLFYSRSSDFTRVDVYWVRFDSLLETLRAAGARPAPGGPPVPVASVQTTKRPSDGPYFGQAIPGDTPAPFAPELRASISPWVEGFAFSPEGTRCFMSVGNASYSNSTLYLSMRVNGEWTSFTKAPFVSDFVYSSGPLFSADGAVLTFVGKRAAGSLDLWAVRYDGRRWGVPVALPAPINTEDSDYPATVAPDGTMYFSRARSGLRTQLYKAHKEGSGQWVIELLGAPLNAQSYEGDPCIAPDGHFLVFYSARAGGQGGTDLYVSFSDGRGGWKAPVNLGTAFNSPNDEYGARLSSDGKYLFFTRHTAEGNGIYWVAVSAIETLEAR